MRHCHFIAPALSHITKRYPRCATVNPISRLFFDQKHMRLTRSTKDKKKGCAYDPGALNKQGALKNQTLRYDKKPHHYKPTAVHHELRRCHTFLPVSSVYFGLFLL